MQRYGDTFKTPVFFAQRRFYTHTHALLHTDLFSHRRFYTQTLLHIGALTQKHLYTQTPLHTDTLTHRPLYTLVQGRVVTRQQLYFQKNVLASPLKWQSSLYKGLCHVKKSAGKKLARNHWGNMFLESGWCEV